MEDSFRVRVDKAFGSLASSSSTAPSSLSSLWSLSNDEIEKREWDRSKEESGPEPESYPSFFENRAPGSGMSSSSSRVELEKDLEDLDDDEDEDQEPQRPDDYDDEQWEIRRAIGRDCTLDYEEEEDKYDKQAIGKENSGDRLYMKDICDDGVDIDSCNVFPTSFGDFVRDPRANHLAAKMRLKEDAEAARKIDGLHVSEKSVPNSNGALGNIINDDVLNPKSILKRKDNTLESKSLKRVRFDSECDDRGAEELDGAREIHMKTSSMGEVTVSDQSATQSQEFASAVPDYIRNPQRYTHYTFDSSSDMDDESNKQACMDFLSQLKKSNTASEPSEALEDLPSVTFISRKKSSNATIVENATLSKQNTDDGKGSVHTRVLPVGMAAEDTDNSDVCAMEEDEPEAVDDAKKSSQRSNRQYRRKAQEDLDEPTV